MANFIKVCCECKKEMERYEVRAYRTDITSHGLCSDCAVKYEDEISRMEQILRIAKKDKGDN